MQQTNLSTPLLAMKNNLPDMTVSLTEEDQLALLKDSIDLRFTESADNEFSQFKKSNALKQFNHYKKNKYANIQPKVSDLDAELLQEQKKTKQSLRYMCCVVICLSLFTPFLDLFPANSTVSGIDLIAMLVGLYDQPIANLGSIIFVTAYPLLLLIYASLIAFLPRKLHISKIDKARARLWSLTATGGIFYFFAALILFSINENINSGISAIGFGYYLSMAAIFAYHFLTQFAERTAQSLQFDS